MTGGGDVGEKDNALELSQWLQHIQMLAIVGVRRVSNEWKDLDDNESKYILQTHISNFTVALNVAGRHLQLLSCVWRIWRAETEHVHNTARRPRAHTTIFVLYQTLMR